MLKQHKVRNYDSDILEIIIRKEPITGFNNLKREGKFHPNMLKNHLTKLENEGRIRIDRTKREHVYSYDFPNFEEGYSILTKVLKKIDRSLKNPELKKGELLSIKTNYLKQAFHLLFGLEIYRFTPLSNIVTQRVKSALEKFQKKLRQEIQNKLGEMSDLQAEKALHAMYVGYVIAPEITSMKTFREHYKEKKRQEKKNKLKRGRTSK